MGWDAHALYGENHVTFLIAGGPERLVAPHSPSVCEHFKTIFAEADEKIKQQTGFGSIVLQGCLQVYAQCLMLERATGKMCINLAGSSSEIYWSPDQVKEYQASAGWDFAFRDEDKGYYWEARVFLETCAVNDLGILYDW